MTDANTRACTFVIAAAPSPQSLMRLLGLFAQRDLLPSSATLTRTGNAMQLTIEQEGLSVWQAQVIQEKMLVMPEVDTVQLQPCHAWRGALPVQQA